MARKPRLEFPGAIYHINHRGNHQEYIYWDDDDRKLFLKLLKTTIERMNGVCHAYCQLIGLFQKMYAQEREPVFQKRIRTILDMENSLGPVPRNQRIISRPELKELFNGNEYGDLETRNRIVIEAFKLFAYTQSEIAAHLELDKTTISKIVNKTN